LSRQQPILAAPILGRLQGSQDASILENIIATLQKTENGEDFSRLNFELATENFNQRNFAPVYCTE